MGEVELLGAGKIDMENLLLDVNINGHRYTIQLVIKPGKFQAQECYCIDGQEYSQEVWTQRFQEARKVEPHQEPEQRWGQ